LWDLVDLSVVVMTVVCTATLTLPVHSHLHTTTQAQHWQQPTSPSFGLCPFVPRKACPGHVTPPLKLTPLPATSVPPQVSPALPPTPTPKAQADFYFLQAPPFKQAPMTVTVKVIKDSYVRPTTAPSMSSSSSDAPSPRVELAGVDILFQRMNLRLVYFFPSHLSAHALKSSLAKVLDKFPILAGRQRKEGKNSHYIDLNGKGVLVRQQLATVAGGEKGKGALLDDHFLKTHVHSFIHGKKNMGVNDERESNLIITLTEVDYEEEERGGTGGGGGVLGGLFSGCMASACYPEAPNEEWQDVSFEVAGEGGGEDGVGKPIRYAVGVW